VVLHVGGVDHVGVLREEGEVLLEVRVEVEEVDPHLLRSTMRTLTEH